jgi:hypothetical protein
VKNLSFAYIDNYELIFNWYSVNDKIVAFNKSIGLRNIVCLKNNIFEDHGNRYNNRYYT